MVKIADITKDEHNEQVIGESGQHVWGSQVLGEINEFSALPGNVPLGVKEVKDLNTSPVIFFAKWKNTVSSFRTIYRRKNSLYGSNTNIVASVGPGNSIAIALLSDTSNICILYEKEALRLAKDIITHYKLGEDNPCVE